MSREKLMFGINPDEHNVDQKLEIIHQTKSIKTDSPLGFQRKR